MQDAYQDLMLKAATDAGFRDALLNDPKAALESYLGGTLPQELTVRVVENSPTELTLVIPPLVTDALSDQELDAVAGGLAEYSDTAYDVMFSISGFGIACVNSAIRLGSVKACRDEWNQNHSLI